MNYLKARRRVPVKLYNPETLDYRDRVLAAGGAITVASLDAVEKFVQDCKNALIWSKLLEIGPFAGSNLNAALVKLARPVGVASALTNVNFVAGDYNERGASGGLLGDGTTKYLNTGFNIQTHLPDNCHLSFYLRDDAGGAGNIIPIGGIDASHQYWVGALTPSAQSNTRMGQAATATDPQQMTKAFYCASRTAANALRLYKNGALTAVDNSAIAQGKPNQNIFVMAYNNSGSASGHLPGRRSFYSIGEGLNAEETTALHQAVRTLQQNLDRAIN